MEAADPRRRDVALLIPPGTSSPRRGRTWRRILGFRLLLAETSLSHLRSGAPTT
jgi:hypothetical protein